METLTYSELKKLKTYKERFDYLKRAGNIGEETFGPDRFLNQKFYASKEWKQVRDKVIVRDNGCDLGCDGYDIFDKPMIHHLNPVTKEQLVNHDPCLLDPENLITVTKLTHNAIHYGSFDILPTEPVERKPGDTKLW